MSGPVVSLPLLAKDPFQAPDAVQDVAFVEVQVSVAALPVSMVVGETLRVAVGTAVSTIVTVVLVMGLVLF